MNVIDQLVIKGMSALDNILFDGTDAGSILDGFGESSGDSDALGGVTKATKSMGGSIFTLIFTVVICGAAIAVLVNCCKILFGGSQGKQEGKTAIVWIIAAVALATCAVSIVSVVSQGAKGIFAK